MRKRQEKKKKCEREEGERGKKQGNKRTNTGVMKEVKEKKRDEK